MRLSKYIEEEQLKKDIVNLVEIVEFFNDYNVINEGISDKIKTTLKKLGIHADPSGAGVIQTIMKGGKLIGQLFWYAMKAMKGDREARERVREIANTEITKEQLMDFILRLDGLTLHILTGPLHMIDALTGWHISLQTKRKASNAVERAKRVINHLSDIEREIESHVKDKVKKWVEEIKIFFGLNT